MAWNEQDLPMGPATSGVPTEPNVGPNGPANFTGQTTGYPGYPNGYPGGNGNPLNPVNPNNFANPNNPGGYPAGPPEAVSTIPEYGPNPNFAPQPGAERPMPNESYLPGAAPMAPTSNPLMNPVVSASQQALAVGSGAPRGPLPMQAPAVANDQDDDTSGDDLIWVNRTKKVIASTQGDPHRRVQLLQQLSVVYLKERYGRTVHADEK